MAYFSNGTEGMQFRDKNCDRCVHDLKGSCKVWLLHLLHNYDQLNDTPEAKAQRAMLNELIPTDADGFARTCRMFHEATALELAATKPDLPTSPTNKPAPWIQEWLEKHGVRE